MFIMILSTVLENFGFEQKIEALASGVSSQPSLEHDEVARPVFYLLSSEAFGQTPPTDSR